MDKTYSDLMDIVNRTKKYDTPTPSTVTRKPTPTRVVKDEPVEYDIEEKPKRKTSTKSSSPFANSKIGELLNKSTKTKSTTAKKSESKSTTAKTSTAKKPATKTTAKSTTTKAKTATAKTETKTTTAKSISSLDKMIAKIEKETVKKEPSVEPIKNETVVEQVKEVKPTALKSEVIKNAEMERAPEVSELINEDIIPSTPIHKVKPADSFTTQQPHSAREAQLYSALKNSLYGGGTDISEYMNTADEVEESTLASNEDSTDTARINDEITKEQQEYEQLFTGSLGSFITPEDNNDNPVNNENYTPDKKNPQDSTYQIETGNKDLDKKIADYYKRKQQMIDKYNSQVAQGYVEEKKEEKETPVDYNAIFSGTMVSRDELMGVTPTNVQDNENTVSTEDNVVDNIVEEPIINNSTDTQENDEVRSMIEEVAEDEDNELQSDNEVIEEIAEDINEVDDVVEENIEDTHNNETYEELENNVEEELEEQTVSTEDIENNKVDDKNTNDNETEKDKHLKSILNSILFSNSDDDDEEVIEETIEEDKTNTPYSNFVNNDNETKEEEQEEKEEPQSKSIFSRFNSNKYSSLFSSSEDDDDEDDIIFNAKPSSSYEDTNVTKNTEEESKDTEDIRLESTEEEISPVEPEENNLEDTIASINKFTSEEDNEFISQDEIANNLQADEFYNTDARTVSLDDVQAIVVDSENTISSIEEDINSEDDNNLEDYLVTDTEESSEDIIESDEIEDTKDIEYAENIEDIVTNLDTENVEEDSNNNDIFVNEDIDNTEELKDELDEVSEDLEDETYEENLEEDESEEINTESLLKNYLSEEELFDYAVTNERLYEESKKYDDNEVDEIVDEDDEDSLLIMGENPNEKFDIFTSGAEDTNSKNDTISKPDFYNEMERLQENIINELNGNKVESNSVDFFAEDDKEENESIVDNIEETSEDNQSNKAEDLVSELLKSIEDNINNITNDVLDEKIEEEENTLEDEIEELNNTQDSQDELVEEEKEPEVICKADPVDPADFDKYNLLNKNVALNDKDLEFDNKSDTPSDTDNYFYLSQEDKEQKASVVDEYMSIYNDELSKTKEMGDINLFKDVNNARPSSEIINEEKAVNTEEKDNGIETIYTLMGIQRKNATKDNKTIKVLYCASECQPFVASGGLADVAGSLPKAIAKKDGVDIRVVMPLYSNIKNEYRNKFEYLGNFTVHLSWRQEYCGLFRYYDEGVTYYFIDNERYFKRDTLYGYYDDGERFAYFSKAIVESLQYLNFFPDIIHCNDWQTALVSAYIKTGNWSDHRYYKIRHIYTIHNVEYQGVYGMENLKDLFGIDPRFKNDMEYNGDINLTKAAIQYSDKFTTVSNSYCDNLKQPYCSRGLHHIIIRNEYKLSGIINGIDYNFYNPETDSVLYKNYDINSMQDKVLNKKLWQDEIGLPVDGETPMIAIVSRLVGHKGLDLVVKIVHDVLQKDVQLVVVGTGDQKYVDYFKSLEQKYPTQVRAFVDKYSNEIARKAYAASDIFVMPSKIEPCGLSQMISSRYGSVPIVREVGGLKDSITDFGCEGGGNGYTFTNYNPNDLQYQIERAIRDYSDKKEWKEKMRICMSQDFTWNKPAEKYIDLYKSIIDC